MKRGRGRALLAAMSVVFAVLGAAGGTAAAEVTGTPPTTAPAPPATTEASAGTDATPAADAASDLSISVEPNTGLRPGQVATVVVGGVDSSIFANLLECPVERQSSEGCRYLATPEPQGDGTALADVALARYLEQEGRIVDCAVSTCEVVVVIDGGSLATPISFDPDATADPPPLLIGPGGPYGDGQVVLVGGTGFPPNAGAQVVECASTAGLECLVPGLPAAGVQLGTGSTSEDGRLLLGLRLSRFVSGTDCAAAPGTCDLRVSFDSGLDLVPTLPLAFDPNIESRPPPSVSITPSTALQDGEELSVEGLHFLPHASVLAQECLEDLSRCTGFASGTADANGAVTVNFTVRRRVGGRDCAVERCLLLMVSSSGGDRAEAPLDFDSSIPPPPGPTFTVSPSTGLVDLQPIDVEASGLGEAFVSIEQCDAAGLWCRSAADGEAVAGNFSATVGVRRVLQGPEGGYDCATEPDGCILRLSAFGSDYISVDQRLEFDPDGPLPDPPVARIVPSSGLVDGELVRVLGSGFDPSEILSIAECPEDPPHPFNTYSPGDCSVLRSYSVRPNIDGSLDHRLQVHRTLQVADGTVRDCARSRCTLVIAGQDTRVVLDLRFARRGTGEASAFPAQLPCVSWPTNDWPTGPLPEGVDPAVMDSIAQRALVQGSSVDSILVVHGGRLVFERYREGLGPDTEFHSFSMAKSMTSSIIGMLIEEGSLDLDGPAPVPEWSDPADPRHAISIRNLLNMSSGLHWTESYFDASSDVIQMLAGSGANDMAHYAATRPLDVAPGTSWQYSTGDSMILAGIIAREVGTGATLDAFLHDRLFDPIGMGPMTLGFDGSGVWIGGARADTTSRSFARFGLLYLRGGTWDGSQVLAEGWADYARTPAPTTSGYGAQFWLDSGIPGSFSAIGFLGQQIEIVSELDLVIVVNSANGNEVDVGGIINQFAGAAPPGCGTVTAADDSAAVRAGRTVAIRVLANDQSTGGSLDRKTLALIQRPETGSARVLGRTILYRAPRSASGRTDTLTYEVCNHRGDCDEAKVTVSIR